MAVSINFNICDNSPECSGIAVCDYDAIYWDETKISMLGEKGNLCVNNDKCTSCGLCVGEDGCPVGAIIYARTQDELNEITKDINIDLGKVKELFVERYGAEAVDEKVCLTQEEVFSILDAKHGYVVIEEFSEDSIQCLLSSIPIEDILEEIKKHIKIKDIEYYKCDVTDNLERDKDYPVLKVFYNNKMLVQIDGYYDNDHKDELLRKLSVL